MKHPLETLCERVGRIEGAVLWFAPALVYGTVFGEPASVVAAVLWIAGGAIVLVMMDG